MTTEIIWLVILFLSLMLGILSGFQVMFVIAGVPMLVALLASIFGHFDLVILQALPQRIFGIMENTLLLAVPLFIMMGLLLKSSGQAEKMLNSINDIFGQRRSGLAIAVLVISALIAASTGIIGATIVMLGTISLPTLLKTGVDKRTASGLICASGTLGQIIPPSIVLILLGDQISNAYLEAQLNAGNFAPEPVTIADLFAGSLLPGLLLVLLYGIYAVFKLRDSTNIKVEDKPHITKVLLTILPTFFLIIAVLGSIFTGVATTTEAAAVGVAGGLLIAGAQTSKINAQVCIFLAVFLLLLLIASAFGLLKVDFSSGSLSFTLKTLITILALVFVGIGLLYVSVSLFKSKILKSVLAETIKMSGMIFGIIIATTVLTLVFRGFRGDEIVANFLNSVPGGIYGALLITMIVIFLLGFILEFIEIIYIVIPIVGPIILQSDINPVWFAVLIALNLQTSFLTPPFGFALFYFRSVAPPSITTIDIYNSIVPFVIIQLIMVSLVVIFPAIATYLPSL